MSTLKFRDIHGDVQVVNENNDVGKKAEVLESELAAMTLESMRDKMKIHSLEETASTLAFEVMQLKLGGAK